MGIQLQIAERLKLVQLLGWNYLRLSLTVSLAHAGLGVAQAVRLLHDVAVLDDHEALPPRHLLVDVLLGAVYFQKVY